MKRSIKVYLVCLGMLAMAMVRIHAADQFLPPPFADPDLPDPIDFPLDPPDPWDDPFDPISDIPLPEVPDFPPEWDGDPFDDQFPLPDPPGLEDPFPELEPSLFPGILDSGEQLGYKAPPPQRESARAAATQTDAAATNVITPLMPFPRPITFAQVMMAGNRTTTPTRLPCDAAHQTRLLIPEPKRDTVAFLDTCPYQITQRVAVGTKPIAAALVPDSSLVLVSNSESESVSVIDLSTRTVIATITLPSFNGFPAEPNAIAVQRDGSVAYVSSHVSVPGSLVYVIDLKTMKFNGTRIPVGAFPQTVALTPDGSQLWVSSRGDSRVDVFDTATNANITSYQIPLATGVAFNPTGTRAYMAAGISPGYIQVVDMQTLSFVKQIPVGNLPHAVLATPTGKHVFVTNAISNTISQIDTRTNTVLRTIKLKGKHPLGLTFVAKSPFAK